MFTDGARLRGHHIPLLRHYFEDGGHDVLLMGSNASFSFQRTNQYVSMGGLDEGLHVWEMARHLRERLTRVSDRFRHYQEIDFHLAGLSLGGQAVLYAALYDSLNRHPSFRKNMFRSAAAISPVIDLEVSSRHIYSGVRALLFGSLVQRDFRLLKDEIPEIAAHWRHQNVLSCHLLPDQIAKAAFDYYANRFFKDPKRIPKPFRGEKIREMQDLLRLCDFSLHAQHVQIPTLVIHSENDWIISPRNYRRLRQRTNQDNFGILELKRGSHCAQSFSYGFEFMSTLLNNFALSAQS